MMLRCKEKETGQVKSSCPKKPFESKKLIVDVIIYVQQKGGDLEKTIIDFQISDHLS